MADMTPEEMQRTMQFLLNNQSAHDARLAEIEINLNKLSSQTSALAATQSALANNQREMQVTMQGMQEMMRSMQMEFREGLQSILEVSAQTLASVKQLAEAQAGANKRIGTLESRVDTLENPSE
jgi:phosphoglycerate-specific signal transduction histidine kinase